MQFANILNLGIKELRSLARDPLMLLLIGYVFTVSVYTAATSLPETLNKAPIAIVDEDHSALSARIMDAFYPPYFTPPVLTTLQEMDSRMDAGLTTFSLDIPPNFQRDVLAGRRPEVQLNIDATRMTQAFTGGGYIQTIVTTEVAAFVQRYRAATILPVELAARARFNPTLSNTWFGAVIRVIDEITMLSIILTGAALIREREHGTIEHLVVMPVTPLEIMVSKIWAMAVVVLASAALSLVFIVQGLLAVPIEGSVVLFLAGAAVYLFATTSMGIFLATMARSTPQFALLVILAILPLQMLSGAVTPRESMPQLLQDVMLAAPTTHYIILAEAVLFRGAGLDVVWPQLLALLGIGAVLFALSLQRFRRFLR